MGKFIDLTGQTFGRLAVLGCTGRDKWGAALFECKCSCLTRTKVTILGRCLRSGETKSCGCLQREAAVYTGQANMTHGAKRNGCVTKEYTCWQNIKKRCYNLNNKRYKDYGGRGIKICNRWLHSFEYFLKDIGEAPSPKHSIERMDNNGDYTLSNCRWATAKEQANNTRRNIMVGNDCLSVYCRKTGKNYSTIKARIRRGWSIDKALNTPIKSTGKKTK